jgi:hypothetical protein
VVYDIRYERAAKAELEAALGTYDAEFGGTVMRWLADLASEAQARGHSLSTDFEDLLATAEQVVRESGGSWGLSWQRFREAGWVQRVRAVIALVRNRKPPWELRASRRLFRVLDAFGTEVLVFYEVDHVGKRIVIRLFDGLPGQG